MEFLCVVPLYCGALKSLTIVFVKRDETAEENDGKNEEDHLMWRVYKINQAYAYSKDINRYRLRSIAMVGGWLVGSTGAGPLFYLLVRLPWQVLYALLQVVGGQKPSPRTYPRATLHAKRALCFYDEML